MAGLSAVEAALVSIGSPKDSAVRYETSLKSEPIPADIQWFYGKDGTDPKNIGYNQGYSDRLISGIKLEMM